tara:strand:+ start:35 stop:919 length:885 start_codon:yes stop_codon:yes gene_type:complete
MNRTLRRPMFRMGGSTGDGITSGLQAPRQGYVDAGDVKQIQDKKDLINTLAPRQERKDTSFNDFLINFGLDLMSRPKQGKGFSGLLSTAAASAKAPYAQYQQAQQIEDAYKNKETSEDRALVTEFVKNLSDEEMSNLRQEAQEGFEAGVFASVDEGIKQLLNKKIYGVQSEPGELRSGVIDTRAGVLIKQDDDLGYDSAVRIAEAAQNIIDGKIAGVTKEDIDTDQLFIETDTLSVMQSDPDTGTLTLPADAGKSDSQDFNENYIEGMVYYNYRDGQFYRKSGKQFIPIQQPES